MCEDKKMSIYGGETLIRGNVPEIKLGDITVGPNHPPYMIAEIGANHNGDMELCKKMIDAAIRAGSHCVKFQSWSTESIVGYQEFDRNTDYGDSEEDKHRHFGTLKDMVEEYQFTPEQHHEIMQYCKDVGVHFSSSAFSEAEVDLLVSLDVPFIKIASMDVNFDRLLKYVAKSGKPIVISTGMSNTAEIYRALKLLEDNGAGKDKVVLLHCRSTYPPKDPDNDLLNIAMMREMFGYSTGYSDHTLTATAPIVASGYGATVIEKHFTTDRDMPGWDHWMSADEELMTQICTGAREARIMMGQWERRVTEDEKGKAVKFRRSIVSVKEIKAGEMIKEDDIFFKRPGVGIRPDEEQYVVGRKAKVDIPAEIELDWNMFE